MTSATRHILVLVLALALAISGALRVAAQDIPDGLTAMVICDGDGETTIWLDPAGRPVVPCAKALCSLCVLGGVAALPTPQVMPAPALHVRAFRPAALVPVLDGNRILAANARAPPNAMVLA